MKKILTLALALVMMALCVTSLASCGNSAKYTVGVLQLVQHDALDAATKGFKDALVAELGEENVEFVEQNANGESAVCNTIAADFVSKKVDLILANATAALQAASAATEDIPVLGTSITEYGVALELENFNGTVGGNVSGTSDLAPLDQQAAMVKELYPDAKKVGLLFCSAEPNSRYQVDKVKEELGKLGYECKEFSFADSNDVATVASAAAADSDVLYVPTDNTAASCTESILGSIGTTPVIAGEPGICGGCGVATLGISYYDLGVTTGKMAAKILKGEAKVSEMPIEYTTASKMYNKERCEELGIDTAALEEKGYSAIEG